MKTGDSSPHYFSYLLRLWLTCDDNARVWRASLESPGTGERQGFASLQALFEFLEAQTQPPEDPGEGVD